MQYPNVVINTNNLFYSACKFRIKFKILLLLLTFSATSSSIAVTYLQRFYINALSKHLSPHILWVSFFILVLLIFSQGLTVIARVLALRESLIFQQTLSKLLYQKKLTLSAEAPAYRTVGETVTLYTQDVPAMLGLLEDVFKTIAEIIFPVFLIPIAAHYIFDIPLSGILTILATSILITSALGYRQSHFFRKNKINSQNRLMIVNELLQHMRTIRILGWTNLFTADITNKRITETTDRLAMVTNGSTLNSISQVTPVLLNVTGILALIQYRHSMLTPGDMFGVLWIFGAVFARPLRMIPFLIVNISDALTSARRLQLFFSMPDESHLDNNSGISIKTDSFPYAISIKNLNLTLSGRKILHDISLDVKKGEFIVIIGEVGSGKSLLFDCLMRTVPATFSHYTIENINALNLDLYKLRQHFSLVTQDAFTISATVKNNVTLSYDTGAQHDAKVLNSLSLSQFDLITTENNGKENAEQGTLNTEIGERGVNLSGGQKQRVNLARSAFFERDIILLDDCLSAVDVHTEKALTDTLLNGEWKNKTIILVTHRMSVLDKADRVLYLNNGCLTNHAS